MPDGKLPALDGRRVVRALTRGGFVIDRVVGSHHVMAFPSDATRTVTVPVHSGRDSQTWHASVHHSAGGIQRGGIQGAALKRDREGVLVFPRALGDLRRIVDVGVEDSRWPASQGS